MATLPDAYNSNRHVNTMIKAALSRLVESAVFFGCLSLLAVLSHFFVVFDILSHFRIQYLVGLVPMFLVAILYRKSKSILLLSLIIAVHGYTVVMAQLPMTHGTKTSTEVKTELRVMSVNILSSNRQFQKQIENILTIDPDVIAIQEYSHKWDTELGAALAAFKYQSVEPSDYNFGIALYSKYPIISGGPVNFTERQPPTVDVMIDVHGTEVRVMSIHPPPPVSQSVFDIRNEVMNSVAEIAREYTGPLVIAGDLNASQWSSHFSLMERKGRLSHTRRGNEWLPSWPSTSFILSVPIDHILVNDAVSVTAMHRGKSAGSDHYSIYADLEIH